MGSGAEGSRRPRKEASAGRQLTSGKSGRTSALPAAAHRMKARHAQVKGGRSRCTNLSSQAGAVSERWSYLASPVLLEGIGTPAKRGAAGCGSKLSAPPHGGGKPSGPAERSQGLKGSEPAAKVQKKAAKGHETHWKGIGEAVRRTWRGTKAPSRRGCPQRPSAGRPAAAKHTAEAVREAQEQNAGVRCMDKVVAALKRGETRCVNGRGESGERRRT